MQALLLEEQGKPPRLRQHPDPLAGRGEVVVALRAAALNHRDLWIQQGLYPGIRLPCVLGSDGAGVVVATGTGVDPALVGSEVVIDPGLGWGERSEVQSEAFRILGMPDDGCFAEQVLVPASAVHPKPAGLGWDQAAALPLAGLTAYRACFTRARLAAGDRVLITGIGGGVAICALQFARAAGARIAVTSSQEGKRSAALELGAIAAYDYRDERWSADAQRDFGAFDVIIDGAGGAGFARLLEVAAPAARIVSYGATAGLPESIELRRHFWKQLNLLGSTMGSPWEFRRMLALVAQHEIRPLIDQRYPLADCEAAFARMRDGAQFGKIVLTIRE